MQILERIQVDTAYIEAFNAGASRALLIKSTSGTATQPMVTKDEVAELLRENIDKNLYLSMNSFKGWHRTERNLIGLKALWLDLDTEKRNYSKETVLAVLDLLIAESGLFKPSYVVDSGHGLYLVWNLETVIVHDLKIVKYWRKVENEVADRFDRAFQTIFNTDINIVDHSSLDPMRVLRIPGTFNFKHGKEVECQVIGGSREEYSLFSIAEEILSLTHDEYERTVASKSFKKASSGSKTKIEFIGKFETKLMTQRVSDLKKLVKIRHGEMTGMREMLLFLMANSFSQITTPKQLEIAIDNVNASFNEPLPANEISTLKAEIKRLSKNKHWYHYKNETIVKALALTAEEAKELSTLMPKTELARRRQEHGQLTNAKRNEKRKKARECKEKKMLNDIKRMYTKGYTRAQIANKIGVSVRTISNKIKKIKL